MQFHYFRADESVGFLKFVDWAAFSKWVREHGTVILEAPDEPGGLMKIRTVG